MVLVDRQWTYSDGNVMGTYTYSYADPWVTYTYSYAFSSQALAQTHTATSPSTLATAPSTTGTPTQSQTSTSDARTRPAAMQATTNAVTTTSPTTLPPSLVAETGAGSASHSSGATSGVFTPSTLAGSSSTTQPIPTGPANRNSNSRGMGTGEIAGIALALVCALGLGGVLYCVWRRRAARRRDSTFIQYPFSSAAQATATMAAVPSRALTPPHMLAEWDTFVDRDAAESTRTTAATVASPTGASGYDGGLAVHPLGEKALHPGPAATAPSLRFSTAFALSSPLSPSAPSPRSSAPFALSPPLSPSPFVHPATSPACVSSTPIAIAPPPAAHAQDQLPSPASTVTLPYAYAWDHPPPSAEYLPRERRASRSSRPPARASYGTVSSTPAYT